MGENWAKQLISIFDDLKSRIGSLEANNRTLKAEIKSALAKLAALEECNEPQPKIHSELTKLEQKITDCMTSNMSLGGRCTLEIKQKDAEEIMHLATNEYHNSLCPLCNRDVYCVCNEDCNHIWYCPGHILNHSHRQSLDD